MDVVRPDNCVLLFPFPRDEKDFRRVLREPGDRYSKGYAGWEDYRRGFLTGALELVDFATVLGTRVFTEATLTGSGGVYNPGGLSWTPSGFFAPLPGLTAILQEPGVGAAILFSHFHQPWEDEDGEEGIEFHDGFRSRGEVAAAVPPSYHGVLDLLVCNPREQAGMRMHRLLLRERPNCNVFFRNDTNLYPSRWIDFYKLLFTRLATVPYTSYERGAVDALAKLLQLAHP